MRKLASVRKIKEIREIKNADAIELAIVDGWNVVIKKGEYNAGDLAVYCEIDSFIPHSLAPFLSKGKEPMLYGVVRGERLRTVRFRGQISQGLLLNASENLTSAFKEGDDVTDFLGIKLYEPPVDPNSSGEAKGSFPYLIKKTDLERVQNVDWVGCGFDKIMWEATEKIDGSSATFAMINGDFNVCSKNINLKFDPKNIFWKMALKYDIENKLKSNNLDNIALQGEVFGEKIQGNYYKINGNKFNLFSIFDIKENKYLSVAERDFMCKKLNIEHVPVLCFSYGLWHQFKNIDEIIIYSDGISRITEDVAREGIVLKSECGNYMFKAISNEYLLK